ncbi:filamentous hemagglutinin N-terminal domain-containing protein [Pleurocapsa sp. PCC 7319]|uniref:beta strand repeat-containing protein n=1 Tax=Pleurocapsa sp. PCC 7319 TaxID=118161 RepID=UPI00034519E5|nr:filamentous hemagglutinin N-terminal domain-containing protein [Pleurocapsa sp. PCC 7319]
MKPCSSILLGFFLGSVFIAPVQAQISPDRTTNTTVTPIDNGIRIDDGDQAGGNLFHSFEQFSIPNGSEAFFNNTADIANIFSRVTGGSISNIDGLIRANDTANLFLLNPAGIIFGENASLNIGGSFLGSTASSILFPDGIEFSATDSENPPLLTINAPLGLGLEDNPGEIVNRSVVENSSEEVIGLEVAPGNNLALIGGQIDFEGGQVTAKGGNIELGGLSVAGTVGINEDGSLSFPDGVTKANVNLSNAADVDARGTGGGSITVNAGNLNVAAGEFRRSLIRAGIRAESTSTEAQAGDVTINVAEKITLNDSSITNRVESGAVGNSGRIAINTGSIEAMSGGQVSASTFGQGDGGLVDITATGDVTFNGDDLDGNPSGVASQVASDAEGNAGGVTISTNNLTLTNGGRVFASTGGRGNAGTVDITATGNIIFAGEDSQGFQSGAFSQVASDAEGNAGGVTISTNNLTLTNGGGISASTFGQGDAGSIDLTATGDITFDGETLDGSDSSGAFSQVNPGAEGNAGGVTISTNNLTLTNGGRVFASTGGRGNAGTVDITATGNIIFAGEDSQGFQSGAFSQVASDAEGNAGGVTISTNNLTLTNGGGISASTFGQGDAGSIDLTATGDIIFDGETLDGSDSSGAFSQVNSGAEGNSEGVTIDTASLTVTNGGQVSASTFGQGNAGTVDITATGNIIFAGEDSEGIPSGAFSLVGSDAQGDAGGVTISTNNLTLRAGGRVNAGTEGRGNAGSVDITATGDITFDGETLDGSDSSGAFSQVGSNTEGNAGGVTISTTNLTLRAGGDVDASTFGQGNAGSVDITATGDITFDGENSQGFQSGATSLVNPGAEGNAGGVTISTNNLTLTKGGRVDAGTLGRGDAGTVNITATGDIIIDGEDLGGFPSGATSLVNSGAVGNAGGVTISTTNLTLTNGGRISASTGGRGDAGSVDLTATEDIIFDGETLDGSDSSGAFSQVNSGAEGNSEGVTIDTASLTVTNGGQVSASTFGQGNAGTVDLTATGDITFDGEDSEGIPSGATSLVGSNAQGNAGGVTISTTNLTLTNGGRVDASTGGRGDAGTVNITATGDITFDGEDLGGFPSGAISLVGSNAQGNAGGVTISTNNLTLTNGGRVDASTFGQGDAGSVDLTATEDITIDGEDLGGFPSGAISLVGSNAQGNAGGVTISTNNLTLTNGGEISASTFGQGDAGSVGITATGNIILTGESSQGFSSGATSQVVSGAEGDAGGITISTTNLILANGRVSASTSGQGETENSGNINLRADNIVLLDNSLISAEALNNSANGGNIDIDAGFVVAFPNQNNDIIANAAQGTGGNINISTNSIFGIEERSSLPANETNDIDASSEFGLDGTIAINQLDVNPVEALEELPMSLIDVVGLVAQNLCQQGKGSEFIVTGKGGVAPNPSQVRDGEISDVDLVAPATREESEKVETVKEAGADREIEEEKEIIEAQGWIINDRGKVELVAQKTDVNGASPQPKNDKICRR